MLVVGYDDNIAGGAFRVNSWGTDWADHGFILDQVQRFYPMGVYSACRRFPDIKHRHPRVKRGAGTRTKARNRNLEPKPGPQPAPTPLYSFSMSSSVEFKMNDGTNIPGVKVSTRNLVCGGRSCKRRPGGLYHAERYHSGDKFRFYINIDKEAYIYAFATDLSGKSQPDSSLR